MTKGVLSVKCRCGLPNSIVDVWPGLELFALLNNVSSSSYLWWKEEGGGKGEEEK